MTDLNKSTGHREAGHDEEAPGEMKAAIKDMLSALGRGWLTVLAFAVAGIALGLLAFFLVKPETTARLELRPIPVVEFEPYKALNALGSNDSDPNAPSFQIKRTDLVSLLVEELETREALVEAFRNHGLVEKGNLSDAEFEARLRKAAFDVSFIPPDTLAEQNDPRNRDPRFYWQIEMSAAGEDAIRTALIDALDASSRQLAAKLTRNFDQYVARIEKDNANAIIDIERNINLAETEYELQTNARLAILAEQAEIARVLNIAKNTLESRQFGNGEPIVTISPDSGPLFLRGYEALEKEMNLLESRTDRTKFIPELIGFQMSKLRIENSPFVDRVRTAFASTPLSDGTFKAAAYSWHAIRTDTSLLNVGLLLFLSIMSTVLGVMFVLTRHYLR